MPRLAMATAKVWSRNERLHTGKTLIASDVPFDGFCRMLESCRAVPCAGWRILPSMDVRRPRPPSNEAGDWGGQDDRDSYFVNPVKVTNFVASDPTLGDLARQQGGRRGRAGTSHARFYDYDIILLDLNLPDISGYEVMRTLRVAKVKTPILILSGLAAIENKVKGLGFGADDYLTKPFHKDELVARIQAIARRSKGHAQSVIATDDLLVNLD
jgi:CheY-like chemotaxis protein